MKALVTGGLGFIGSHLVRKLVDSFDDVRVIDDLSSGAANINNLGSVKEQVAICIDTIVNYKRLNEMAKGVDVIFHLATQCLVKGMDDPVLMHQTNDIGSFNVCMTAKENKSKVVYISTSEVYGEQRRFPIKETASLHPKSLYALTKIVGENYLKFFHDTYGVKGAIIRPFNTFGPLQREDLDMARMLQGYNAYAGVITSFIKRYEKELPPIIFGDGRQSRDFTYVTDTVDGILLLAEKLDNCETVNLGLGKDYTIREIASLMNDIWNKDYEPIFGIPRINDISRLLPDITLAQSYGYKPKVKFEDGLRRYVDWYRGRK